VHASCASSLRAYTVLVNTAWWLLQVQQQQQSDAERAAFLARVDTNRKTQTELPAGDGPLVSSEHV